MRKIGIHLEQVVVGSLESPLEPGDVSRSKTELCLPVQDVHPGLFGDQGVGEPPSPVGRVVVYHEDLEAGVLGQHLFRSEERRVGEEGRSRWSAYHLKKKKADSP